ncbi:RNA polymerase sigma factor [Symbioplanes lichenis]|uniref:RNA polymerase sigma factor n=1 Tax=Symbioplanes lichenis TaxID=1629072 RepID=UPI00273919B9|nr:sigma-70 family RNA polymerase sigma factor [Actinoplanes lichenis]
MDAVLARDAQAGDISALGLLLARHRPAMYAVALSLLGRPHDAEDAVQEAALIAVRRIGDLRDNAAAGPWLKAVTRNVCRAQLRRPSPVPAELPPLPDGRPGPEEQLDRLALGDWVWQAVGRLSPALREVVLLRHFTGVTRYDDIAAICGLPVGTVRSRLSQARAKLAEALTATADTTHDDHAGQRAARRTEAEQFFGEIRAGRGSRAFREFYAPAVESFWPTGKRRSGVAPLVEIMDRDLSDGVRQFVTGVAAAPGLLIWEAEAVNPPDDPEHCPPTIVWMHTVSGGRMSRLRIFHQRERTFSGAAAS